MIRTFLCTVHTQAVEREKKERREKEERRDRGEWRREIKEDHNVVQLLLLRL